MRGRAIATAAICLVVLLTGPQLAWAGQRVAIPGRSLFVGVLKRVVTGIGSTARLHTTLNATLVFPPVPFRGTALTARCSIVLGSFANTTFLLDGTNRTIEVIPLFLKMDDIRNSTGIAHELTLCVILESFSFDLSFSRS